MKLNLVALTALTVGAVTAPSVQAQVSPDNYVGVGIRAGFNDSTAFVIDSKVKLTELADAATLSVRPAVLFDDSAELRLPISVDFGVSERFYPYAGAGVAYNAEGSSRIDPLITGGVDVSITRNLVLDVNLNVLFKPNNTDTELTATINYAF
jgi:hypothetical protein